MADRLHQVGLTHSDAAIEEQRVVGFGRLFRYRPCSSLSKLIARTGHEVVEGVFGIQLRSTIPVEPLLG